MLAKLKSLSVRLFVNAIVVLDIYWLDFIRAKSYEDTETTGILQLIGLANMKELENKNVVIVDDIIDSGLTMSRLIETIKSYGAKQVWTR